jgi:hypothetical protein
MSEEDDYQDDVEEYEISNLLNYFKKNNIGVNGIFTSEGRTIFLLIQYLSSGIDLFIYIPSKFSIKPDNSVKNYFHINMKADEVEEDDVATGDVTPVPDVELVAVDCVLLPLDDEVISLETPLYRKRVCCSKNGSPQVTTSAIVHPSENISILSLSAGSQG